MCSLLSFFGRSVGWLVWQSLAVCAVVAAAGGASGQTYTNSGGLVLMGMGPANPYPSTILVTGGPQSITGISVAIDDLTHMSPGQLEVCLVAPDNTAITLMKGNGGTGHVSLIDFTFAEDGEVLPGSARLVSTVYRPNGGPGLAIAGATYVSSLANFQGIDANGEWRLFVNNAPPGSIGGVREWTISFTDAALSVAQPVIPYQGRLEGGPVDGTIDVRYSVWKDPVSQDPAARVQRTQVQTGVPIAGGLFAANLRLDAALPSSGGAYLQLEIANPSGTAFVAMSPRQLIRTAPLASRALLADVANDATSAQTAVFAQSANVANTATNATNAVHAQTADVAGSTPWSGLTGQAGVTSAAVGTGWQFKLVNASAPAPFRGGIRQSDLGFLEVSNIADAPLPTFARLSSNGAWTAVSDARLKSEVTPATGNLAAALALRPVNFRWNSTGMYDFGLIAQDVKAVMPGLVSGEEDKQMLTVNYSQLSVVAIGAIQELTARNDALEARVKKLEAMLEARGGE